MWRKWPCYEATSRIFTSTNMISLRVDVELSCNHLEASCYRRTLSLASSANIVFSDGLRIWISSIAILGFQNITEAHGPLNLLSTTSGKRGTCIQTPTARHATSSLFLLGQSFTVLIHYKSIPDNFVESPTALSRISGATGAHLDVFLVVMIPFFFGGPIFGMMMMMMWWTQKTKKMMPMKLPYNIVSGPTSASQHTLLARVNAAFGFRRVCVGNRRVAVHYCRSRFHYNRACPHSSLVSNLTPSLALDRVEVSEDCY